MARGDQRERDRAKKQKELEKRAKSQPKVSFSLERRKTNDAVLYAEMKAVVSRNCVLEVIGRTASCLLVNAIN